MYRIRVRRWAGIFGRAGKGLVAHDSFGMGAALAFYTIFSLGPILVLATAVAGRIVGAGEARSRLIEWGQSFFGRDGVRALENMIAGARNVTSSVAATSVGIITLFLGTLGVFGRLKHSLNTIWGVDLRKRTLAHFFLVTRLKALVAACAVGFALFLALVLSATMANIGRFLGRWLPLPDALLLATNLALSLVIVVPLFALIFKYMPDIAVRWRSAWAGACTAGILFQAGAVAMGAYLSTKVLTSVYGAAGSVLAVLLWAYYTTQTVLYGAEVSREHAQVAEREALAAASPPKA